MTKRLLLLSRPACSNFTTVTVVGYGVQIFRIIIVPYCAALNDKVKPGTGPSFISFVAIFA